jgi:hypothetical protein
MNRNIVCLIMTAIILFSCVPSAMGLNYTNKSVVQSNNSALKVASTNAVFTSNITYVSLTGNDANNGTLNYPKRTIKAAVSTLKDNGIVIIGPGTYDENNIIINKSITIRGSTKTDVKVDGTNNGIIFNISGNVKIQNISFVNGNGEKGGAIYNDHNGTLNIADCIFQDNNAKYGGAIFSYGSCSFYNCEFARNHADGEGGAINNNFKGDLTVINTEFSMNTAISAAAIFSASECKITGSKFNKNTAKQMAGAIYTSGKLKIATSNFTSNEACFADGGAIVNKYTNNTSPVSIDNCNFSQNHALTSGAINNLGICNIINSQFIKNRADSYGGSIANTYKLTVKNTAFSNNKAGKTGGGIVNSGTMDLEGNTFTGNNAIEGGAITTYGSSTINYNKFANNTAQSNGGAISNNYDGNNTDPCVEMNYNDFTKNNATEAGGALFNNGKGILRNNNFTMNTVTTADVGLGGGILNYNGTLYLFEGNVFFHNTIFTGRSTGDPEGGGITNLAIGSLFISGSGNIFTDSNIYNEGISNLADCIIEKNTDDGRYLNNQNAKKITESNINITNSNHTYDNPCSDSHLDVPSKVEIKQGQSTKIKAELWRHDNGFLFEFDTPMDADTVTFKIYNKEGNYYSSSSKTNLIGNAYNTISTENLPPGDYCLQIASDGGKHDKNAGRCNPCVRTIDFIVLPN